MKRITRAQLKKRPLEPICKRANTTTNEYGKEDNRIFCYGLIDSMNDELLEGCVYCGAYVGNADPIKCNN